MAESIISPGVFTRENDISFIQPAPIAAGAAFIGPTVKGPDNQPTIVTSYNDYTRKFGETFTSASNIYEFLTSVAVKSYFSQGGQTALITRVVSGSYTGAESTNILTGLNKATGSGTYSKQWRSATVCNIVCRNYLYIHCNRISYTSCR
jgi:uncharacterized protein